MFTHNPVALAKDSATVDRQSNGRLELGLGAGWLAEEAEILGNASDHPGARLAEAIDIMRSAWRDSPFEHAGRFWSIPPTFVRPPPIQEPGVPIWIGGSGPARLELAIRIGAAGVFLGAPEGSKVAKIRRIIPEDMNIGLHVNISDDFDRSEIRDYLTCLRRAGATLVVLAVNRYSDDANTTIRTVERFASELLDE